MARSSPVRRRRSKKVTSLHEHAGGKAAPHRLVSLASSALITAQGVPHLKISDEQRERFVTLSTTQDYRSAMVQMR